MIPTLDLAADEALALRRLAHETGEDLEDTAISSAR